MHICAGRACTTSPQGEEHDGDFCSWTHTGPGADICGAQAGHLSPGSGTVSCATPCTNVSAWGGAQTQPKHLRWMGRPPLSRAPVGGLNRVSGVSLLRREYGEEGGFQLLFYLTAVETYREAATVSRKPDTSLMFTFVNYLK